MEPYICRQPDLTSQMRAVLVDWLVEVQENFELNHETLYLAGADRRRGARSGGGGCALREGCKLMEEEEGCGAHGGRGSKLNFNGRTVLLLPRCMVSFLFPTH